MNYATLNSLVNLNPRSTSFQSPKKIRGYQHKRKFQLLPQIRKYLIINVGVNVTKWISPRFPRPRTIPSVRSPRSGRGIRIPTTAIRILSCKSNHPKKEKEKLPSLLLPCPYTRIYIYNMVKIAKDV